MRFLKVATLAALALMLVLAAKSGAADDVKGAKKKKTVTVTGTVVEVKKDDDKDTGTVKVKVTPKKKKGDTTAPVSCRNDHQTHRDNKVRDGDWQEGQRNNGGCEVQRRERGQDPGCHNQ